MLVLARKVDESIVIGDNIVVKVVAIENGVVKLGIEAPKEIAIIRNELLEAITKTNRAAVGHSSEDDIATISKLLGK
jgi:carbon storage regulator CsrA